jgi:hypothetical protein
VTVYSGTIRSGSYASLAAQDNVSFQLNSASGATAWYGRIYSVPNTVSKLSVTYAGSESATCSQTVSIWNWTSGYWLRLDARSVGTTAATITVTPAGTLASYVSGTTGSGDVAVLVQCARTDATPFVTSADLLNVVYS